MQDDYGFPEIEICLPMPTSVNAMYKTTRQGRRVPSKEYREYIAAGLNFLIPFMPEKPLEGRLALWGVVYFPNKRRNDVQNRIKSLCDLLEKARFFNDDSQIDDIRMVRGDPHDVAFGLTTGYVSIRLWEIK